MSNREPYQFVPVDVSPDEIAGEEKEVSRIQDVMQEFHRGTYWEIHRGEIAQLALEDTFAKITNYYVVHDRDWTHGPIVDFISMDEGSGTYMVYALFADGVVLMVPDDELDQPVTVTYEGQVFPTIHNMPKQVKDVDELSDRILAEKDRILEGK